MVIEEHGASWTPLCIIKKCTSMLVLLSRDSEDKLGEAFSIFNEYCHNIFEHENDDDRMIRPCLENYDWSNDYKFREYLFNGIYTVFKCMPAAQKKYVTLIVPIIMSALGIKTVTFCKVTDMKDRCSIYRFMERVCADVLRIDSSIPAIVGSPIYRELIDIAEQSSFAEVAGVELFNFYRR